MLMDEVFVVLIEQQTIGIFALLIIDNLTHQGNYGRCSSGRKLSTARHKRSHDALRFEQGQIYNCYKIVL